MKKHFAFLLAIICIISFVSCTPKNNDNKFTGVIKVYDILSDESDSDIAKNLSFTNEAFPGVTFHTDEGLVLYAVKDGKETLRIGESAVSVFGFYLCDLTGDGVPELCLCMNCGSGICDKRIEVYDYNTGSQIYTLNDRSFHDYRLSLHEDGVLYAEETKYTDNIIIRTGTFVYEGDAVNVKWIKITESN